MSNYLAFIYFGISGGLVASSLIRAQISEGGITANAIFSAVLLGMFWPILLVVGAMFAVFWACMLPLRIYARVKTGSWDVTINLRH